ncbi:MAG TPA: STAS domain-containing protein [Candidatus Sumerlaeota bacterium]|nr:STAS domain-containing protein [Candidatus Sumerlaeota bacterium]
MNIVMRQEGDVEIIIVQGSIVADTIGELKKCLDDCISLEKIKVVVDLADVNHVDSSGLAAFVSRAGTLRKKNGDLRFSSMNAQVRSVFDITFLTPHFRIFDDLPHALAGFQVAANPDSIIPRNDS